MKILNYKFNKDNDMQEKFKANMVEPEEKKSKFKKRKVIIPFILGIIAVIVGWNYFIYSITYVSTDDAYIDGHNIQISPKISGNIIKVYIDDNQKVKKGQLLVEIDPIDYQVKYEHALSAVEGAKEQKNASEQQISQSESNLDQINADINSVKAEFDLAEADFNRYTSLYKIRAASKQDFDRAETNYKLAKAKLDSYTKKASAAQEQVSISGSQNKVAIAGIKQLQTAVKQAKLNISYTKIYAPVEGVITSKAVEEGAYVQTGQPLFAIVPEERWVVANFKETQLTNMKPGQIVYIKLDTYQNKVFKGRVDSIQSSTGSASSMFPPENAVGSFVKVVQRVPVKIIFTENIDPKYVIVPGMSVIPEVKIK
jgi:membrane fusion protein (multidrug efflux system)